MTRDTRRGIGQGVGLGLGCCAAPFVIAGILLVLGILAVVFFALKSPTDPRAASVGRPPGPSAPR